MSSNTMIAIKDGAQPNKVVANLLPCRIQHNGPVDPIDPFWKATEAEGTTICHVRNETKIRF